MDTRQKAEQTYARNAGMTVEQWREVRQRARNALKRGRKDPQAAPAMCEHGPGQMELFPDGDLQ